MTDVKSTALKASGCGFSRHDGMVGWGLVRRLARTDCTILAVARRKTISLVKRRLKLGCKTQSHKRCFWRRLRLAAWLPMTSPRLYDNLAIAANVTGAPRRQTFEGSLFSAPAASTAHRGPIKENALLTGQY